MNQKATARCMGQPARNSGGFEVVVSLVPFLDISISLLIL